MACFRLAAYRMSLLPAISALVIGATGAHAQSAGTYTGFMSDGGTAAITVDVSSGSPEITSVAFQFKKAFLCNDKKTKYANAAYSESGDLSAASTSTRVSALIFAQDSTATLNFSADGQTVSGTVQTTRPAFTKYAVQTFPTGTTLCVSPTTSFTGSLSTANASVILKGAAQKINMVEFGDHSYKMILH